MIWWNQSLISDGFSSEYRTKIPQLMNSTERLKGLETFVAVAEAGSFTAAADRLNLTNSAIGKTVARLEERLHQRLFERTTRRLELTDAGAAFYKVCVQVLDELEQAERQLAAQQAQPSGRMRVDLPATFGRLHALPALVSFTKTNPLVVPHVSFTDRFVDLVDDGLDMVVRIGGDGTWPAAIDHRYLGREELIFCASPAYLASHGTPRTVAELLGHEAVLYGRADGSSSPWLIQEGDTPPARQAVNGRAIFGQAEAQAAAVEAGLGVGQLATWLVEEQLRAGKLVRILPELTTDGLALYVVWQRSRQHSPKVQALLRHFEASLSIRPVRSSPPS